MPPDGSLNYLKHIADDLGSCGVTRGGSSPLIRINKFDFLHHEHKY